MIFHGSLGLGVARIGHRVLRIVFIKRRLIVVKVARLVTTEFVTLFGVWSQSRRWRPKSLGAGQNSSSLRRAALLRRPGIQGRAAALPYQEGEDFCHGPKSHLPHSRVPAEPWSLES